MRGFEDHEIANHVDEWRSRIHPKDLDRVLQSLDAYLAKQRPEFCEEYRFQEKDGSYIWILDRGVALWADDGVPLRMVGSESDITERKRGEVALQESESRFRNLFEQSPIAYQSLDITGRFIDVNDQLCDLLGYSREELIGRAFDEVWAGEHGPMFPDKFDQFKRQHQITTDLQLVKKTGEIVTVVLAGRIQRDKDASFLMTHCILTDITERKRAEEALRDREAALARFKSTLDQTQDCVFMFDPDSRSFFTATDDESVLASVLAGAQGYVLKDIDSGHLVQSIRAVSNGQSILNPALTKLALSWVKAWSAQADPMQGQFLSPQEERVLALVAESLTNKEIAARMQLSDKTVKNYLANMFQKLGISRRTQAATFFVKRQV